MEYMEIVEIQFYPGYIVTLEKRFSSQSFDFFIKDLKGKKTKYFYFK